MLVIKWLLHVNSCAHGAARDRASGRKRVIRQSRALRGGMGTYGRVTKRARCALTRAAAMVVLKRVSLSHTSYAARNVGLCHAFGMRHAYALALDVSLRRFAAVHAVTCILRGPWLFARLCGARIYQSKACENAKRVVAIA